MNPLNDPEDLDEATVIVNRYAKSDWLKLSFSQHAREQMANRILPHDVLLTTLCEGSCVDMRKEIKSGRMIFSYEFEYRDAYGRVTVVTAIPGPSHLHIVTAFTDIPD